MISKLETRKASWLPPLPFQLPSTSEEDLSQITSPSGPLLSRSQTCTTASCSVYSRNSPRSGSCHPSTISYASERSSHPRPQPSEARRWLVRNSLVPAIPNPYHHQSHTVRDEGKPVRPGTRPPIPPAEFWTYASKQHMCRGHSTKPESSKKHGPAYGARKREPSLCRYPLITPSSQPVYQTQRCTVHSETAHVQTISYENLRKGETRKIDEESFTRSHGGDAHFITNDMPGNRRSGTNATRRDSRTLVKMRQPRCG